MRASDGRLPRAMLGLDSNVPLRYVVRDHTEQAAHCSSDHRRRMRHEDRRTRGRTKLSALLDRVERGEEITITRRGRPVAQLVPVADDAARRREASEALKALRDLRETLRRRGVKVTFDEIKHWIEKGRL